MHLRLVGELRARSEIWMCKAASLIRCCFDELRLGFFELLVSSPDRSVLRGRATFLIRTAATRSVRCCSTFGLFVIVRSNVHSKWQFLAS